jgi:hypothetical protein
MILKMDLSTVQFSLKSYKSMILKMDLSTYTTVNKFNEFCQNSVDLVRTKFKNWTDLLFTNTNFQKTKKMLKN